ncbi:MAG: hypothetical protein MR308_05380 [Lachnospiraceae bacterium]|nr:hypothetical protein [Lachnospiraceae bacterium]
MKNNYVMKSKNNLVMILMMALMICIICPTMVFAASEEVTIESEIQWELNNIVKPDRSYNVSTEIPRELNTTVYGLVPPEPPYLDLNKQTLTFAGEAQGSTLYTNNGFYGKTRVTLSVNNWHSTQLTIKLYKYSALIPDSLIKTIYLPANAGQATTIANLDSSANYYLAFYAPSDFSGSVQ